MFYQSVETAYKAGEVRVLLPALGRGDNRVYLEASGLNRWKVMLLSKPERQRIADLSKADAKLVAGVCASCNASLEPSYDAALQGEHQECACGAVYKVVYAMSDASQLRLIETDSDAILSNCSVRFQPKPDAE